MHILNPKETARATRVTEVLYGGAVSGEVFQNVLCTAGNQTINQVIIIKDRHCNKFPWWLLCLIALVCRTSHCNTRYLAMLKD